MINTNFIQNNKSYNLNKIDEIFLLIEDKTISLKGFASATYECEVQNESAYAFQHSLTLTLSSSDYYILKEILGKKIQFAFSSDNIYMCDAIADITYSYSVGNKQNSFQITFNALSNNNLQHLNSITIDEQYILGGCEYETQTIDSLRVGVTSLIDVEYNDDDFTVAGNLYNIDAKKTIVFEEKYEDNIISQSVSFSLPFNTSTHSFSDTLLKYVDNEYTCLLHINDTFIICGVDKGLIPLYNISENTINVTLSNNYTQHTSIIAASISNVEGKDKYEIIEYKCYNNTNTATLLNKKGTNEYVCFKPYLAEYQGIYKIIETFEDIYTNKYNIKLYNDNVICTAGNECVIIGLPSKVSFNYFDEVKEFDVTSYCSIAFQSNNAAEVRLYDGKLTIKNKSDKDYNIVCTDSNSYKRIIYVSVQNFTEIPSGYDIDAYGGTLEAILSNDASNLMETSSSVPYRLNGSGNGILFEVPANTSDEDIDYITRIYYNDNTCDIITITSKKGYTIKYYDNTINCIDGDKWQMFNTLMGKTEDKITDEVGYQKAYIIEKNCLECLDIKEVKTIGSVTLYSQKHNINQYTLSTGEIIYKVVNTNEYSNLNDNINFWKELEDMYIYDGQDTVYQDVLFVVFDDNEYRTDYTTPSYRKANVDLSSIIQEKNTNSPLYKWADTGEVVEDDDTSINCAKSVPVDYDPENKDTWYCVDGVRYLITEEYIDLHCTGDWQFIGYSLAGTVGTFADSYVDCGLPDVGLFDVLIIYNDQRYKIDTYIDGKIIEGQYSDNDDIERVVLGDGITSIGEYAFYNCSSLSSVTFGQSLIMIGDSAFENCKINLTDFNDKLVTIGTSAFYGNDLKHLTIPTSVTNIGNYAFARNRNLTNIFVIGNTDIASNAFADVAQNGTYTCECGSTAENAVPNNWEIDCF